MLEYDGTAYHGWQRQPNGLSVQEVVEGALARLTGEDLRVVAAGRTDAGVHALAQVAAFTTRSSVPAERFRAALNSLLPADIRVRDSRRVAASFHPQFEARGKTYRYFILNRPEASALLRNRCWHIRPPLDLDAMRAGAAHLLGRHDFSSFRSSSCCAAQPVRELTLLAVERAGGLVELTAEGDGFLKNMVRNIVGTLADVGLGTLPTDRVADILAGRDRRLAGRCAPPWGLYLAEVRY